MVRIFKVCEAHLGQSQTPDDTKLLRLGPDGLGLGPDIGGLWPDIGSHQILQTGPMPATGGCCLPGHQPSRPPWPPPEAELRTQHREITPTPIHPGQTPHAQKCPWHKAREWGNRFSGTMSCPNPYTSHVQVTGMWKQNTVHG